MYDGHEVHLLEFFEEGFGHVVFEPDVVFAELFTFFGYGISQVFVAQFTIFMGSVVEVVFFFHNAGLPNDLQLDPRMGDDF
ncbi:MAG: hypothetical protein S4CHLAM102_11720 [Chlamydiia bacterium]|nr:hypothetical protein [Chlamydiia bacterium]